MKKIYSKENLEGLVFDLIKYLYKTKDYYGERLSKDIYFYSMNKRYSVDEKNYNFKLLNIPIYIEENIKVKDYFEFCNKKSLTIAMESRLHEYLYNYDVPGCEEVSEKVDEIFKKHGFYYDFGANWYLIAYEDKKTNKDK